MYSIIAVTISNVLLLIKKLCNKVPGRGLASTE